MKWVLVYLKVGADHVPKIVPGILVTHTKPTSTSSIRPHIEFFPAILSLLHKLSIPETPVGVISVSRQQVFTLCRECRLRWGHLAAGNCKRFWIMGCPVISLRHDCPWCICTRHDALTMHVLVTLTHKPFSGQSRAYSELLRSWAARSRILRGLFLRDHGRSSAASDIVQNNMVGAHDHIVSSRASE